jgi:hypothetical protein
VSRVLWGSAPTGGTMGTDGVMMPGDDLNDLRLAGLGFTTGLVGSREFKVRY